MRNAKTLRLSTYRGDATQLVPALRIHLQVDGLVQMAALDPAYEPIMVGWIREGVFSNTLGRDVFVEDGMDFLLAVEDSLCNSSYWVAEWFPKSDKAG